MYKLFHNLGLNVLIFSASAALLAKNTVQLGHQQLEARVRELEVLLEEVVKDSDTALEALRARETDLTQQVRVSLLTSSLIVSPISILQNCQACNVLQLNSLCALYK